jgi:hypothetical protein
MTEEWNRIHTGEIEGRNFELLRHTSGELQVNTMQKEAVASSSITLVISAGDPIEITGENPDELEINLQNDGDFTPNEARAISNLAR